VANTQLNTIPEVQELVKVSTWLAQKGWSEAGSGNISVRFDQLPPGLENLESGQPMRLPSGAPKMGGALYAHHRVWRASP
jgi:ribulose-5-phosphate 4-epimerase/fuculose-1-phosphate aldolase